MFLLINDYSKILQKLKTSDRPAILEKQIRALEKEIQAGGAPRISSTGARSSTSCKRSCRS